MRRLPMWTAAAAVVAVTLVLSAGCSFARGEETAAPGAGASIEPSLGAVTQPSVCAPAAGERITRIATAKLIIEFNFTDDDLGVHGAFDDQGWSELCVLDPNGRPILVTDPRNELKVLTMAGIFFESREPPASEFSMADLKAAFPAGRYQVRGVSFDGTVLVGEATFTHDVPAPPEITSPEVGDDAERPGAPIARDDLDIEWTQVSKSIEDKPITITGYQVIVTKVDHDDPHGFSRPVYDVHVRAGVSELGVPGEFLEPDTVYEVEVLAIEESGNQTISVGFFKTT